MSKLAIAVSATDHLRGDAAAPCILVEYGDYQCPHCGHAHPIVKEIQKHFGNRLAFVYRNFPLKEMHPQAEPAAEAAEFAGEHEKFWEMHDQLFENQNELGEALYERLVKSLGLVAAELRTALQEETYHARVRADFMGGARSGVNGTPTFFINGKRHDGPAEFSFLKDAIEQAL